MPVRNQELPKQTCHSVQGLLSVSQSTTSQPCRFCANMRPTVPQLLRNLSSISLHTA